MLPANSRKVWIRNNAQAAIDRACQLVEEMGAGEVVGGMVDVYARRESRQELHLTQRRSIALLGTDLTKEEMLGYLEVSRTGHMMRHTNEIVAPTFRQDIHRTGRPGRGGGKILRI